MSFQIENILFQTGGQGSGKTRNALNKAHERGDFLLLNIEEINAQQFVGLSPMIKTIIVEGVPPTPGKWRVLANVSTLKREILFIVNTNEMDENELKRVAKKWV